MRHATYLSYPSNQKNVLAAHTRICVFYDRTRCSAQQHMKHQWKSRSWPRACKRKCTPNSEHLNGAHIPLYKFILVQGRQWFSWNAGAHLGRSWRDEHCHGKLGNAMVKSFIVPLLNRHASGMNGLCFINVLVYLMSECCSNDLGLIFGCFCMRSPSISFLESTQIHDLCGLLWKRSLRRIIGWFCIAIRRTLNTSWFWFSSYWQKAPAADIMRHFCFYT